MVAHKGFLLVKGIIFGEHMFCDCTAPQRDETKDEDRDDRGLSMKSKQACGARYLRAMRSAKPNLGELVATNTPSPPSKVRFEGEKESRSPTNKIECNVKKEIVVI